MKLLPAAGLETNRQIHTHTHTETKIHDKLFTSAARLPANHTNQGLLKPTEATALVELPCKFELVSLQTFMSCAQPVSSHHEVDIYCFREMSFYSSLINCLTRHLAPMGNIVHAKLVCMYNVSCYLDK